MTHPSIEAVADVVKSELDRQRDNYSAYYPDLLAKAAIKAFLTTPEVRDLILSVEALLAAKDEKDANGKSEKYQELKRNAWGNLRVGLRNLETVIDEVFDE